LTQLTEAEFVDTGHCGHWTLLLMHEFLAVNNADNFPPTVAKLALLSSVFLKKKMGKTWPNRKKPSYIRSIVLWFLRLYVVLRVFSLFHSGGTHILSKSYRISKENYFPESKKKNTSFVLVFLKTKISVIGSVQLSWSRRRWFELHFFIPQICGQLRPILSVPDRKVDVYLMSNFEPKYVISAQFICSNSNVLFVHRNVYLVIHLLHTND
jgi:hypothetical protein